MRRLFVTATMCAAIFALTAGPATATKGSSGHKDGVPAASARHVHAIHGPTPNAVFVPAHEAVAAGAAISGTIRDYSGAPIAGARVDWYVGSGATGNATTDGAGSYSFAGIPPTAGDGELGVLLPDQTGWFARWRLTWDSPGPTTFDMQPGAIDIDAITGGPWGQWATDIVSDVFTSSGTQLAEAYKDTERSNHAAAPALPGALMGVAAYFFDDEGAEVPALSGQTVTAGATLAQGVTLDEASAQRVWTGVAGSVTFSAPWASGRPGSRLKVWLQNFPSEWTNRITGYSGDPATSASKDFGTFRSLGTTAHSRTLIVPAKAVPGYAYRLNVAHATGPLTLSTFFQVCTLKSSKTAITKGTAVRFSGVVPVDGHSGSTAGTRTYVNMFAHKGTAGQPTKMDPRKQGWQYIGRFRTDGYGKYRTALLKPRVTMSVVMQYPGDDSYYAAYTSPVKITVR